MRKRGKEVKVSKYDFDDLPIEDAEEQELAVVPLPKNRSLATLLSHQFQTVPLNEEWRNVLGEPEVNFVMFISGPSGGGKTTFALKLAKYLSTLGRCYYNSVEQGFSKSFKDQVIRAGISADSESRFMIGSKDEYEVMRMKIERGRPRFIIIDSLQYIKMSVDQLQALTKKFKKQAFIIISWETGGQPKGDTAKAMKYISDIKCRVVLGVATCQSRYGETKPYQVFKGPQRGKNGQLLLEYQTDRDRLAAAGQGEDQDQDPEPPD
jgi:SpoVK/Ycf46/Vps4 family AAA+-type ATPase